MGRKIYRIISFAHAVEMFNTKTLHFNKPSAWDDPYEKAIKHEHVHRVFAQCWSTKGMSDAMWRIYSKDNLGIRIRTTEEKLNQALEKTASQKGLKYRIGTVEYLPIKKLNEKYTEIRKSLSIKSNANLYTESLYYKRLPFIHESEFRVSILTPSDATPKDIIKIEINPTDLIDKIIIDPRAPKELADALIYYFKEKLKFKKTCRKSILYSEPADHEKN